MNYRFVLWDFDGTLADSLAVSLAIFNRLALLWDFKPVDDPLCVRRMSVPKFLKEHKISFLKVPGSPANFIAPSAWRSTRSCSIPA
jgi:phosphoglycolate phosphatase-like HAD superfamily hydrolase